MVVAGEASGDWLAAELVRGIREVTASRDPVVTTDYQPLKSSLEPRFFGAGGSRMAEAGVELDFDLTRHAVIGFSDVVRNLLTFRKLFLRLRRLARERQPDAVICVDFSGFNRRLAHAIRRDSRNQDWFHDWHPKLIQYVSPQVWASREGRVHQLAQDYDLILSIFPFEKAWYAQRVPKLRVEFVGHPLLDKYKDIRRSVSADTGSVVLLPGSRPQELARHLPVLLQAFEIIRHAVPDTAATIVLPSESLVEQAGRLGVPSHIQVRCGGLPEALLKSTVALASTGTVTMECAFFGLPTVALYKTSWSTYQIGKRVVKVNFLAMPNLLAGAPIFPEFVQDAATPNHIAGAAIELLKHPEKRELIRARLREVVASLGGPGASRRAAEIIVETAGS
jgi:lipid-A-disaccharide synthase